MARMIMQCNYNSDLPVCKMYLKISIKSSHSTLSTFGSLPNIRYFTVLPVDHSYSDLVKKKKKKEVGNFIPVLQKKNKSHIR